MADFAVSVFEANIFTCTRWKEAAIIVQFWKEGLEIEGLGFGLRVSGLVSGM